MFQPHHLELFYYVARYGGISASLRHIPYGIGQPAVSGQMADFERRLGTKLFYRRPFQLTEEGQMIYEHIQPCHEKLGELWERVHDRRGRAVRIAVAPGLGAVVFSALRAAVAPTAETLRWDLLRAAPADMEAGIRERRAELAITLGERRAQGLGCRVLGFAGLSLLVRRPSAIRSASHFWGQAQIKESLICPPLADPVARSFHQGLGALRVTWDPAIRVESSATMQELVAAGQGVGVGLNYPWVSMHPELQALPLKGFAPVPVCLLWHKPEDALLKSLLGAAGAIFRDLGEEGG